MVSFGDSVLTVSSAAQLGSLGADLLSVVARLNRMATQRTPLPLPWAQARLLAAIEGQGPTRITTLAALDHCAQPTMTLQVRRLEEAGLVARAADPRDARAVLIAITDEGARVLEQVRSVRAHAVEPILARLDDETRRMLTDVVGELRRVLDDNGESPHATLVENAGRRRAEAPRR